MFVKTDLCSDYIIVIIDNCCDRYFLLFSKRKVLVFQEKQYPSIIFDRTVVTRCCRKLSRVRFPSHHCRPAYYEIVGGDYGC